MCAKAGVPLPPNLKPAPPPTIEEKVAKKSGGATIDVDSGACQKPELWAELIMAGTEWPKPEIQTWQRQKLCLAGHYPGWLSSAS